MSNQTDVLMQGALRVAKLLAETTRGQDLPPNTSINFQLLPDFSNFLTPNSSCLSFFPLHLHSKQTKQAEQGRKKGEGGGEMKGGEGETLAA